jgi:DNA-binding NarL/FixJ family response regulator
MTTPVRTLKKRIRILIADQEGIFRLGLKKLIGVEDDLRVVAQAVDAEQTVAMTREFTPEVAFVQADILGPEPETVFGQVRRASSETKVVVTASAMSEEESLRYVKLGAAGVILKSVDPELFLKCARKVAENELWLPKKQVAQMAKMLDSPDQVRPRDTLTNREKTVISYLMQGWRNREIAQHLAITEQTVKNHLRIIYDKVGVSDRLELVLYAIHQRLELPPVGPAAASPPAPKLEKPVTVPHEAV